MKYQLQFVRSRAGKAGMFTKLTLFRCDRMGKPMLPEFTISSRMLLYLSAPRCQPAV